MSLITSDQYITWHDSTWPQVICCKCSIVMIFQYIVIYMPYCTCYELSISPGLLLHFSDKYLVLSLIPLLHFVLKIIYYFHRCVAVFCPFSSVLWWRLCVVAPRGVDGVANPDRPRSLEHQIKSKTRPKRWHHIAIAVKEWNNQNIVVILVIWSQNLELFNVSVNW